MMQLNPHHIEKLRDGVRENPLKEVEVRRIEGLGEQYITLASYNPGDDFTRLYKLAIDDVEYVFWAKLAKGAHQ